MSPEQKYNLLLAILATIPTMLTALAGLIVAWRTHQKVAQVEAHTNGMQVKLIEVAEKTARDVERAFPTLPDPIKPPTQEHS